MRVRWDAFAMGVAGMLAGLMLAGLLPAGAATGEPLILGEVNRSDKGTVMRTGGVRSLKIVNNRVAGVPLELVARPGQPPMRVNSTVKVQNLNADRLDGRSAGAFMATDRILYASVTNAGNLYGAGNAVSASHPELGHYEIVFGRSVVDCVGSVNTGWASGDPDKGTASIAATYNVSMGFAGGSFDDYTVTVILYDPHDGHFIDSALQVMLICPPE